MSDIGNICSKNDHRTYCSYIVQSQHSIFKTIINWRYFSRIYNQLRNVDKTFSRFWLLRETGVQETPLKFESEGLF